MKRRDQAVQRVRDNWDDEWDVYEIRPTSFDWPLLLGRPHYREQGPDRRGGNRVILTKELVDYLTSIRYQRGACDLPIGATALKRIRRLLGFNIYDDLREWWEDHADELASMTETEFATLHNLSLARVSQVNKAMFGNRLREPGWYNQEPARSLLVGTDPRADVAERLGISVGAVGRLRWQLRKESA